MAKKKLNAKEEALNALSRLRQGAGSLVSRGLQAYQKASPYIPFAPQVPTAQSARQATQRQRVAYNVVAPQVKGFYQGFTEPPQTAPTQSSFGYQAGRYFAGLGAGIPAQATKTIPRVITSLQKFGKVTQPIYSRLGQAGQEIARGLPERVRPAAELGFGLTFGGIQPTQPRTSLIRFHPEDERVMQNFAATVQTLGQKANKINFGQLGKDAQNIVEYYFGKKFGILPNTKIAQMFDYALARRKGGIPIKPRGQLPMGLSTQETEGLAQRALKGKPQGVKLTPEQIKAREVNKGYRVPPYTIPQKNQTGTVGKMAPYQSTQNIPPTKTIGAQATIPPFGISSGNVPPSGSSITDPIQNVIQALKQAKPIRGKQEQLYTQERGKRLARVISVGQNIKGEKGYFAQLGQLKGELPKAQYESLRGKIGQQDIDSLFTKINDADVVTEWEKLSAKSGLAKVFGEAGGAVPTEGELKLLNRIFGKEFTQAVLEKRPMLDKIKDAGYQLFNLPRSLMASFDLSAPFRQGIFLIGKPKQFAGAFRSMFKQAASEQGFKEIQTEIFRRPTYQKMAENKLALLDVGNFLTAREEAFVSSWAEKIPIIGRVVRASNRGYTGFLNKLRADVFDEFVRKGEQTRISDPRYLSDAANFINNATGRGSLGGLERSALALNSIFFSPRLIASRLNLLNPIYYMRLQPQVRKEALKSLFTFAGMGMTVLGLAKLGGADVGTDPRSADFGKIRIGDTRYDIWGGFQQYIRTASQLLIGKIVSSSTGLTTTLGEGYRPITRKDIIQRFFEGKMSPVVSFALGLLKGKSQIGANLDIPKDIGKLFTPIIVEDLKTLIQEEGIEGLPKEVPAIFGVGTQTYKDFPLLKRQRTEAKKEVVSYFLEGDIQRARDLQQRHKLIITNKDVESQARKQAIEAFFEGNREKARDLQQRIKFKVTKKDLQKEAKDRAIDFYVQGEIDKARQLQQLYKFKVKRKEIYGE